jgi:putative transposase
MALFNNKYRVESTRLKNWDYGSVGFYFVTICTRNREYFFGDVVDGEVVLSKIGELVAEEWLKTPAVRKNVELDEWIVMPNHVHGVVVIKGNEAGLNVSNPSTHNIRSFTNIKSDDGLADMKAGRETRHRRVSTKVHLQSGSLGAIVNQFKSVCTRQIRAVKNKEFDWQPRFYDHIIRSERSLKEIQEYIFNNPAKWELDRNNPANLWM